MLDNIDVTEEYGIHEREDMGYDCGLANGGEVGKGQGGFVMKDDAVELGDVK